MAHDRRHAPLRIRACLLMLLCCATPALAQQPITPKIVEGTRVYPAYPDTARRLGIQGMTTLRVQVGADGQVGEVNVVQSAGHPDLDRAAADAVRRWRFEPARRGKDTVPMSVQLAIKFTLETRDAPDPKPLGPLKAGVITALDGNVAAQRVAFPMPVPLKANDDIFLQDTITTGDGARMEMVLDSKVLVSMPERTVVTISEVSGRGTLDLGAGQLTVNARGDRPQSGQALEIRTPNAVAILRGAARLRVETVSPAPQGRTAVTHIDVLDGSISVVINVDFGNQLLYRGTTPVPIDLGANQGLTITGEVPGAIRPLRAASPTK
jgi:TonB family protein